MRSNVQWKKTYFRRDRVLNKIIKYLNSLRNRAQNAYYNVVLRYMQERKNIVLLRIINLIFN